MQWQKLSNVNAPIGVLLLLHNTKFDAARFAIRESENLMKVSTAYRKGRLTGKVINHDYGDLKCFFGEENYWCLYKKPCE